MTEDAEVKEAPKSNAVRIFYPVLFAIFPVLSIYSANLSLVPYRMIIRPLLIAAVIALVLWGIFSVIFRNSQRAAVASSALVAMGFAYSRIKTGMKFFYIPYEFWMYGWIFLTLLLVSLTAWKWRWHRTLNILSVSLVVAALGQICYGIFQSKQLLSQKATTIRPEASVKKDLPDIIYIILDGYGRSDALKRALNFSDNAFVEGLEKRGFYVAKDSKANYCQTELSLASSLNMDFIPVLLPKVTSIESDRGPLSDIIDKNAAAEYLRGKGYVFGAITSQFPPIQFESADVNMRTRTGMTLIETALIQMTPLGIDEYTLNSMFSERRSTMKNQFDALTSLSASSTNPRFVVVHILAPHPPFVFGPNGEEISNKGPFGYWDGSDFMDHIGTPEDYRKGYIGQAEYMGKRVLQAVDTLVSGSKTKPIIMIQGDHGSKMRLDQGSLEKTDVNECFPNLNAYFVPESIQKTLYPGITPVNSFRVLFNGLFGEKMKLRPDRSWYSTFPAPFDFVEVTTKVADHEKMASVPVPDFGPRPPIVESPDPG